MAAASPITFPETLPDVRVEVVEENTEKSVVCDELQWWFVIPRVGETSSARFYDRDSGRLTMARETAHPVSRLPGEPGSVRIAIDESTSMPVPASTGEQLIVFTARLTPESADFLSADVGGRRSDGSTPGFHEDWGTGRGRVLRAGRRLVPAGPQQFLTTGGAGVTIDLVTLSIGQGARPALRVLDLETGEEPQEITQPIIDLETGRTLVYWQYRPEAWDADSGEWRAAHPGAGLMIDGVRYLRRNCTGRDTVAITDQAARLFAVGEPSTS